MNQIKQRRIQQKSIQTKRDNDDDDNDDNDDDNNNVKENKNENLSQNDAFSQSAKLIIRIEINVFIYIWNFLIDIKNRDQFLQFKNDKLRNILKFRNLTRRIKNIFELT